MSGSMLFGIVCTCMLWSGVLQERPGTYTKVPEHAQNRIAMGRKGDGLAMLEANQICETWGIARPFHPNEVQKALLPLALSGHPKAMWAVGISMVRYAEPGPGSDQEKGRTWIQRSAEAGHAPAMLHMVSQVRKREEQNQWITRAYESLLPRAQAGEIEAMLDLQHVPYLLGDAKNPGRALLSNEEKKHWLRKAVALGSTEAMIMLADSLRRSQRPNREETLAMRKESIELSQKLIEMGHWPTLVDIGVIYADGAWPSSGWNPTDLGPDGEKLRSNPAKAWDCWDKAIAIAGKEAVMRYLLEHHSLGDEGECQPLPPRPKAN